MVATTAHYLDSLVGLAMSDVDLSSLSEPDRIAEIGVVVTSISDRPGIVGVKLWSREGRILFSDDPSLEGKVFAGSPQKAAAWGGGLTWRVTPLDDEEHLVLRARWGRLLEIFCPIRDTTTGEVFCVAAFYHSLDALDKELAQIRQRMWLLLAATGFPMFVLLAAAVRGTSRTIWQQDQELHRRVGELSELLAKNQNLNRQVIEIGATVVGTVPLSYLGVPIFMQGKAVGVLSVQSTTQEGIFTENDKHLLSTIVANVATSPGSGAST